MVCYFLLYNKVNQLYIYICSHISSLLHLPPSHPPYPTPLGGIGRVGGREMQEGRDMGTYVYV